MGKVSALRFFGELGMSLEIPKAQGWIDFHEKHSIKSVHHEKWEVKAGEIYGV